MGKNIVRCGDAGTGQVAKICNNMLLGISMIGVAEAMNSAWRSASSPRYSPESSTPRAADAGVGPYNPYPV